MQITSPLAELTAGLSGAGTFRVSARERTAGPIVDELVRGISTDLLITDIWMGEGELDFPEAYGEELDILAPLKVGRGYRFSFSYSVTNIETLSDLT